MSAAETVALGGDVKGVGAGPDAVAAAWLSEFGAAVEAGDVAGVLELLAADPWWRDLFALTWDVTAMHGGEEIAGVLTAELPARRMADVRLDESVPPVVDVKDGVRAFYTFTTDVGVGRGVVRLRLEDGAWKGWTISTELRGLRDFPESQVRIADAALPENNQPVRPGGRLTEQERRARELAYEGREPDVLVIGGGHCGLFLAARLKRLGVDTLVVDRFDRAGDNWRLRYNGLALHDTKWWSQFPYMPYPETWPLFTPKDKLADWLEAYVNFVELNLWTRTQVKDATYDAAAGTWTVRLTRDGVDRVLHPHHLVFATGNSGEPYLPRIEGAETFAGTITHSSGHAGGQALAGKKVIVVGSGSSGHDVTQDAYENGAQVTMVQRGATHVHSQRNGIPLFHGELYSESSPPIDVADMISASLPSALKFQFAPAQTRRIAALDAELLGGLEAAGFSTTLGPDDQGMLYMGLVKAGGYYIDKGASTLIVEKEIELRNGEIVRFTPTGVGYDDGTEESADVVVFCTGYSNMREAARPYLGDQVTDRLSPVWGLDETMEVRAAGRHSGHPKLWFFAGGFQFARIMSRQLSLLIKAIEEGLVDPNISVEKKKD
ncbi:FAD-dependent oxidoreductase [Acrocarpospora pleiomorpha]|uniref:FAD-dependent oxidoreductase n=1 Tax=Acrocarpospora pleiomorpha TaxID=90975 RepID=A0A5M3XTM1_9ACTN|nr:NAD(P)/FAD-dependent oxidoreductase [Acrocarpospora pleiomorpha]GES24634.1 FAD-dependent oxidoreductase [Acrocarpospora pleiomorpha]